MFNKMTMNHIKIMLSIKILLLIPLLDLPLAICVGALRNISF